MSKKHISMIMEVYIDDMLVKSLEINVIPHFNRIKAEYNILVILN